MSTPLDEFLVEKKAGYGSTIRSAFTGAANALPEQLAGSLAGAATLGTVGAAGIAAKHLWDAATKARDFRTMLMHNQDLAEHSDPAMVNQAFTTLRRFNPEFSKDPMVSGSFVRRIVESPAGAGGIIQEALSSAGKMPSPFGDMASEGAKAGLKFKDPAMAMRNDLGHQAKLELLKNTIRAPFSAAERATDQAFKSRETDRLFGHQQGMEDQRWARQQQAAQQQQEHQQNMEMGKAWHQQGMQRDQQAFQERLQQGQQSFLKDQGTGTQGHQERMARLQAALKFISSQQAGQTPDRERLEQIYSYGAP